MQYVFNTSLLNKRMSVSPIFIVQCHSGGNSPSGTSLLLKREAVLPLPPVDPVPRQYLGAGLWKLHRCSYSFCVHFHPPTFPPSFSFLQNEETTSPFCIIDLLLDWGWWSGSDSRSKIAWFPNSSAIIVTALPANSYSSIPLQKAHTPPACL